MESGVLVCPGLNQRFALILIAFIPWFLEPDLGCALIFRGTTRTSLYTLGVDTVVRKSKYFEHLGSGGSD